MQQWQQPCRQGSCSKRAAAARSNQCEVLLESEEWLVGGVGRFDTTVYSSGGDMSTMRSPLGE